MSNSKGYQPTPEEVKRLGWKAFFLHPEGSAEDWRAAPEVKDVLQGVRAWGEQLTAYQRTSAAGKMSPEARRFVAARIRALAAALLEWARELEK